MGSSGEDAALFEPRAALTYAALPGRDAPFFVGVARAILIFRAGGPVRSDFASRSQARICSGSSPGRAAYDAAVQHNRPQIRPATVPLCVVFFVFYSCVALL